jgi:hypothetical protein
MGHPRWRVRRGVAIIIPTYRKDHNLNTSPHLQATSVSCRYLDDLVTLYPRGSSSAAKLGLRSNGPPSRGNGGPGEPYAFSREVGAAAHPAFALIAFALDQSRSGQPD